MPNYCKFCFKKIEDYSLFSFIHKKNNLCESCFSKMKAKFIKFKIGNTNGTALYEYSDVLKELIYKFKGCYDYELNDVFMSRYMRYLRVKYYDFYIVYVPSFHIDDERRGFNHVRAIFSNLKLKELDVLSKESPHKQSDQSLKNRSNIKDVIAIDQKISLKGKKILLVDDIMTTGSTLLASIDLLRKQGAKKIEVLVIAKTKKK